MFVALVRLCQSSGDPSAGQRTAMAALLLPLLAHQALSAPAARPHVLMMLADGARSFCPRLSRSSSCQPRGH